MNKGFSVKMNKSNLKKLTNAQLKAAQLTANKLLSEKIMQQEIPFDEGTLQNVQSHVDASALAEGHLEIVHDTPYAMRLYYNPQYHFSKEDNVNAKGEWWEDYITGKNKYRPNKIYNHYLKQSSGGVIN